MPACQTMCWLGGRGEQMVGGGGVVGGGGMVPVGSFHHNIGIGPVSRPRVKWNFLIN